MLQRCIPKPRRNTGLVWNGMISVSQSQSQSYGQTRNGEEVIKSGLLSKSPSIVLSAMEQSDLGLAR